MRIYRGMPKQERDERGYRAARSQHAYWEQNNRVTLIPGRIQYPAGWPDDSPWMRMFRNARHALG